MQILHKEKIQEELDKLKRHYKKLILLNFFFIFKNEKKGINAINPRNILPAGERKGPDVIHSHVLSNKC